MSLLTLDLGWSYRLWESRERGNRHTFHQMKRCSFSCVNMYILKTRHITIAILYFWTYVNLLTIFFTFIVKIFPLYMQGEPDSRSSWLVTSSSSISVPSVFLSTPFSGDSSSGSSALAQAVAHSRGGEKQYQHTIHFECFKTSLFTKVQWRFSSIIATLFLDNGALFIPLRTPSHVTHFCGLLTYVASRRQKWCNTQILIG